MNVNHIKTEIDVIKKELGTFGKLVVWEHFGLMDQKEYRQKTIDKLHFYMQHGFFPSDNLICTYEHDLRDIACVQKLIEAYLLR